MTQFVQVTFIHDQQKYKSLLNVSLIESITEMANDETLIVMRSGDEHVVLESFADIVMRLHE